MSTFLRWFLILFEKDKKPPQHWEWPGLSFFGTTQTCHIWKKCLDWCICWSIQPGGWIVHYSALKLFLGFLWPFYSLWITHFSFLWQGSSGCVTAHAPGHFCPWTISWSIGLNMLTWNFCMSWLDSLLGYASGDLQVLQLIVLVSCGAVD